MTTVDPRVIIKAVNPGGARLGFDLVGAETRAGGAGGWEALARPRRTATVEWAGVPPLTLTLPLMLSGAQQSGPPTSIEAPLRILEDVWCKPHPRTRRPPILQVTGLPWGVWRHLWVINDAIGYGDVMRGDNGHRVQVEFTLSLLEYVAPSVLRRPTARARANRSSSR
ncbi:hypothetical protein ACOACO_17420 [Nocardioides sp. CPCC 205120]|uniref:hypothetical protein n=1 Tax=Nocardioides sp. CPCC 205120 TaxID=3406462 RepID=UPI003B50D975